MRLRPASPLLVLALLGCSGAVVRDDDDTTSSGGADCVPGEQSSCACPDGGAGTQVCDDDGGRFGACRCEGADTASTGAGAGGPTATSGQGGGGAGGAGAGGDGGTSQGGAGGGPVSCDLACGSAELCEAHHAGIDDDCDGLVDEGCDCDTGEVRDCFAGDPTYRDQPGCFAGVMRCSPSGTWGACEGGVHADDPGCQEPVAGCHAITTLPFRPVDLRTGTGTFDDDADSGTWTVACPEGVSPCPAVSGPFTFRPMGSGEYEVTYTKSVEGQLSSCTYPLVVGSDRGLRVELGWDHTTTADLDLHLLQPGVAGPIDTSGASTDCAFNNCTAFDYAGGTGVDWFPPDAPPGEPTAWSLDPDPDGNACYFAPRGQGEQWALLGLGCHNPRLELDLVSCDPSVTEPTSEGFCAPESSAIDVPPTDAWMRIAVVHYSGAAREPTLKIFCDGALRAELGAPTGGPMLQPQSVWVAADVAFVEGPCSTECVVRPVYADPALQTPWVGAPPASGPPQPPPPGG